MPCERADSRSLIGLPSLAGNQLSSGMLLFEEISGTMRHLGQQRRVPIRATRRQARP